MALRNVARHIVLVKNCSTRSYWIGRVDCDESRAKRVGAIDIRPAPRNSRVSIVFNTSVGREMNIPDSVLPDDAKQDVDFARTVGGL